ncbi:MAG: molybdenum cofactor guanylyltransferase [Bacteroidia bacterium]|nr:molybdenum cofactor guanylyltransferase [Bacteroidia bacterium]
MIEINSNITAAVLAGGKNSRMSGFNKAFIQISGTPIIERTIKHLKKIFQEVIIVTNKPRDFKHYDQDVIIITDTIKDLGPLAGIHSALSMTSGGGVFFVACDMPFLHNEAIIRQVDYFNSVDCDCLVPRINLNIEPLHAIYTKRIKNLLYKTLAMGKDNSIRGFLPLVNTCYWDLPNTPFNRIIFSNINTEEDLEDAKSLLKNKIKGLACEKKDEGIGFWVKQGRDMKG